ncbi:ABC transporter substrate-binding protein [Alicyclobacillus fodiniaquatilis]|uniref:ABC transporter substrate-binding protein n=1 Tax=Alicyclobacillus fodiniaquatilis TaxID=1661150 RepID=A0ABW4JFA2_9BACL
MNSKFTKLGIALAASATLTTACSAATNQPSTSTSGKTNQKVTINWYFEGPQTRATPTQQAIKLYEKLHPNVTIKAQFGSWTGYQQKLTVLAAAHNLPDIVHMDMAWFQSYASKGVLLSLNNSKLAQTIPQKYLNLSKYNGQIYGVPVGMNGSGYEYDIPEIKKLGLRMPWANWTYNDYFKWAQQAAAKLPKGHYAIVDSSNSWQAYQSYQQALGEGEVFPGGNKIHIVKNTWIQFMNIYAKFRKDGVVPPAAISLSESDGDPTSDALVKGWALIVPTTAASANVEWSLLPGKIGVVNDPIDKKGGGWQQPTIFESISASSANAAQAEQFLGWLYGSVQAGKILGTSWGLPLKSNIWKAIAPSQSQGNKLGEQMLQVGKAKALGFYPLPPYPAWNDWSTTYTNATEAVMYGKESVTQAYNQITQAAQQALSQSGS